VHTTIGIDIHAPAPFVFDLARHVERWDRLLPHYARSRVAEGRADGSLVVDFVARRPLIGVLGLGLPVAWRSRTWSEPGPLRLRFVHVAGATRGMDVTWRIEPTAAGCRVSIDHDFRPRLPGFAAFVERWFTRPIAGRTLGTFKALAEALAESVPASSPAGPPPAFDPELGSAESEPAPATNIPV
jgi:ribosome-associated toxin RatA of RatAB toxin-antitoxin module